MAETVTIRAGAFRAELDPYLLETLPLFKAKRLFGLLKEGYESYSINERAKYLINKALCEIKEARRVELRDARIAYLGELSNDAHTKAQRDRTGKKLSGEIKKAETKYNKARKLHTAFHTSTD